MTILDEHFDRFFNHLHLNKYICVEDWLNRNSDISSHDFITFIYNHFDSEVYMNKQSPYLINTYKELCDLQNELRTIIKQIKINWKYKPLVEVTKTHVMEKIEEEMKELEDEISKSESLKHISLSNSEIEDMSISILKNVFSNLKSSENITSPDGFDVLLLLDDTKTKNLILQHNEISEKKDNVFKKLYCLLIFHKEKIKINDSTQTFIYHPNSEKIFITSDFISYQKLIKYLSDIKDTFKTPRSNKYIETINKRLNNLKKYIGNSTDVGEIEEFEKTYLHTKLEPTELKELIKDLIELINYRFSSLSNNNSLYYRGHSDSNYTLTPSISRNSKLIVNENRMYHEIMIRCSDFFTSSKHNLEILTLMQHYSIPTRLLDVSSNPLSALYFSVTDNKNYNGEIVIFCTKEDELKYYHSDTVEILSTLSVLNHYEKQQLEREVFNSAKYLVSNLLDLIKKKTKITEEDLLYEIENCINEFNKLYVTKKLVHEIGKRNTHFQNTINPFHLYNSYFVLPIMNNSRITRQSGAFIITGLHNKIDTHKNLYSNKYHLPSSFTEYKDHFIDEINSGKIVILESNVCSDKNYKKFIKTNFPLFNSTFNIELNYSSNTEKLKKIRLIIPSTNEKQQFSDWLNIFGINQASIYPEIEKVGEFLNQKYNE